MRYITVNHLLIRSDTFQRETVRSDMQCHIYTSNQLHTHTYILILSWWLWGILLILSMWTMYTIWTLDSVHAVQMLLTYPVLQAILGALFFQEISHPGIRIQRFWLMMPKPPFPPQVPLEPHFKGEWWARLAGLSGLSFNHKWDPLPTPPLPCLSLHPHLSLSTSLTLPHCPLSLPLWVREIAVSALSSFSPTSPHQTLLHLPFLPLCFSSPSLIGGISSTGVTLLSSLRSRRVLFCPREGEMERWGGLLERVER